MKNNIFMANWKMNKNSNEIKEFNKEIHDFLVHHHNNDKVIIFPSDVYLSIFNNEKSNLFSYGSQNISSQKRGAFTGETSGEMLKDLNVQYVLIGHSERRKYHNENNIEISKKVNIAIENNIKIVLCIGETLEEKNENQLQEVLLSQISTVFDSIKDKDNLKNIIIAYEPVWSIGTGLVPSCDSIQNTHKFIRDIVSKYSGNIAKNIKIVYGGSLNDKNAKQILSLTDVNGGLIGGASLESSTFINIIKQGS